MVKKWMTWINMGACAIIILLLLAAVYLLLMKPSDFPKQDIPKRKSDVPKSAFSRPSQDYEAINTPILNLKFSPLSVQLPDLRRHLTYFGSNARPDSQDENPVLYFAFNPDKTPAAVFSGKRHYLLYDKLQKKYLFSSDNHETSLWMEAVPKGNQVIIKIGMRGENGEEIKEPVAFAEFALAARDYVRSGVKGWNIGQWRVDGTLLARQKTKWYGIDRFLERHGGEEYKEYEHKQRIDFGENEDVYSIYVGPNDCLIWKEDKWRVVQPGKDSLNYPLMCVKKVDDRIMSLELWDVEGKGKMTLNILKTTESWLPKNLVQGFKFMGARTRSQFVFEINKERFLLRPKDWLVLTDKGWQKLVSREDIDNFVDRKLVGPLFVFDGIQKKDDRQVIVGTMFNAARTDKVEVEIPLQGGGASIEGADKQHKQKDRNGGPPGNSRRIEHHKKTAELQGYSGR